MKKVILFALSAILLMGCGKFSDGQSIWAEGLWVLPLLTGLGAIWFWYVTLKAQKSGSNIIDVSGKITDREGGKMPLYQIGQFWFAVGLTIATIGIVVWQNLEK